MPQSSNSNYEYNIKNRNEIPLRAYLRADACSQPYRFLDTKDPLVSETMFWESEGLYLDYSKISGRVISISSFFNINLLLCISKEESISYETFIVHETFPAYMQEFSYCHSQIRFYLPR